MATKAKEPKTKEYIFRITKTRTLNPFLNISYESKNKEVIKHIQFRNCVFITKSPYVVKQLLHWTEIADIELADESETKESVIKKGIATTMKYYGDSNDDDDDDDDDILNILEG